MHQAWTEVYHQIYKYVLFIEKHVLVQNIFTNELYMNLLLQARVKKKIMEWKHTLWFKKKKKNFRQSSQ